MINLAKDDPQNERCRLQSSQTVKRTTSSRESCRTDDLFPTRSYRLRFEMQKKTINEKPISSIGYSACRPH